MLLSSPTIAAAAAADAGGDRVPGVSGPHLLSRRTALGCAAAVPVALTGCEIAVPGRPPAPGPGPGPGAPAPAAGPDTGDDTDLLAQVLDAVDATSATVVAALARHRELASSLQPLLDLHAAHRDVLQGTSQAPAAEAGSGVPQTPDAATSVVRRAEERLADRLTRAAVAARSGDLARVLASMSAGVTQHVAVLGEGPR